MSCASAAAADMDHACALETSIYPAIDPDARDQQDDNTMRMVALI
jgi:hypothetical protein